MGPLSGTSTPPMVFNKDIHSPLFSSPLCYLLFYFLNNEVLPTGSLLSTLISYLCHIFFFVDDVVVFGKVDLNIAQSLKNILNTLKIYTDLKVNTNKSTICISKHMMDTIGFCNVVPTSSLILIKARQMRYGLMVMLSIILFFIGLLIMEVLKGLIAYL